MTRILTIDRAKWNAGGRFHVGSLLYHPPVCIPRGISFEQTDGFTDAGVSIPACFSPIGFLGAALGVPLTEMDGSALTTDTHPALQHLWPWQLRVPSAKAETIEKEIVSINEDPILSDDERELRIVPAFGKLDWFVHFIGSYNGERRTLTGVCFSCLKIGRVNRLDSCGCFECWSREDVPKSIVSEWRAHASKLSVQERLELDRSERAEMDRRKE